MTELKFDLGADENIKSIISDAILKSLDQGKRDLLIKESIQYLITPKESNSYGKKSETPMQEMFRQSCRYFAEEIIQKEIEENAEIRKAISDVMTQGLLLALKESDLPHQFARIFSESIKVGY